MPNATIKVKLPTGMRKVDVNLHKPVIFLNGQKRSIDKAWVFVNGEKKMLWGEQGVMIDYITPSSDIGSVFAIGENWVDTSEGGIVSVWDMSNLSDITLKESAAWGKVGRQNEYQTTEGHPIYYGDTAVNSNKMELNTVTGRLTVLSSINGLDNHTVVGTGSLYALRTETLTRSFTSMPRTSVTAGGTVKISYGTNFYWNGSLRYSTGRRPDSASDTSGKFMMYGSHLQIGDNSFLINMSGTYSTGAGLYLAEYSGLTKLQATCIDELKMLDGDRICCVNSQKTDFFVLNKNNFTELYRMSVGTYNVNVLAFIGELNGYYYLVKAMNFYDANSVEVKLLLLDRETYQVVWEQDLPADPFNQYDGKGTFWKNASPTIQKSQTGFLALTYYNALTGENRIVRFGGLL